MRFLIDKFQLFCLWLVMDSSIRTGRLAPYIFGLGMGRMPHKVKDSTPRPRKRKAGDADGAH